MGCGGSKEMSRGAPQNPQQAKDQLQAMGKVKQTAKPDPPQQPTTTVAPKVTPAPPADSLPAKALPPPAEAAKPETTPEKEPAKKHVKFTSEVIDKAAEDDFEARMAHVNTRDEYDRKMTYGSTDAMFKERVDTVYKKKVLTEEQKMAALLGPAYAKKKKAEQEAKEKEEKGEVDEAEDAAAQAKAEEEKKRKEEEDRLAAALIEQERQAKEELERKQKEEEEEAERQRLAAELAEIERQAREEEERRVKQEAEEAEQQRLALELAEIERQARAEEERRMKEEEEEKERQRLAAELAEIERQAREEEAKRLAEEEAKAEQDRLAAELIQIEASEAAVTKQEQAEEAANEYSNLEAGLQSLAEIAPPPRAVLKKKTTVNPYTGLEVEVDDVSEDMADQDADTLALTEALISDPERRNIVRKATMSKVFTLGTQGNTEDDAFTQNFNEQAKAPVEDQVEAPSSLFRRQTRRDPTLYQGQVPSKAAEGAEVTEKEHAAAEQGETEEIADDFMSQQPYEVFGIVMQPDKVEMTQFLERDEEFEWRFKNPLVENQIRSVSLDMAKPYDLGEDELPPRKESEARKSSRVGADVNPYL